MKTLSIIMLILACSCANAATRPSTGLKKIPFFTVTWTSDGNPNVPVCGDIKVNCKSTIDIINNFMMIYSVPVTQNSITIPNFGNNFQIRTTGYDGDGNVLYSALEPIP